MTTQMQLTFLTDDSANRLLAEYIQANATPAVMKLFPGEFMIYPRTNMRACRCRRCMRSFAAGQCNAAGEKFDNFEAPTGYLCPACQRMSREEYRQIDDSRPLFAEIVRVIMLTHDFFSEYDRLALEKAFLSCQERIAEVARSVVDEMAERSALGEPFGVYQVVYMIYDHFRDL